MILDTQCTQPRYARLGLRQLPGSRERAHAVIVFHDFAQAARADRPARS